MEWQPIETAPTYELVLLSCVDWIPSIIKNGACPVRVGGYWDDKWNVLGASWTPTHWMPLPKPPSK